MTTCFASIVPFDAYSRTPLPTRLMREIFEPSKIGRAAIGGRRDQAEARPQRIQLRVAGSQDCAGALDAGGAS